jgi:fluoroquinolone resistance protein
MADSFHLDQTFENIDHALNPLEAGEYENCSFSNCKFANGDLSNYSFIECKFSGCDLSMVKLGNTALKEVEFYECKMLGIRFDACLPFLLAMSFTNCQLNFCSFQGLKLKSTQFSHSILDEADFSNCDLNSTVFDYCRLERTTFNQCILLKADFRTATGFDIDPENNRMKSAKFSKDNLSGLLVKYSLDIK